MCTTSESSNVAKVLKTAEIENSLLKRSDYGYLSTGRTAEPLRFACVIRRVNSSYFPAQNLLVVVMEVQCCLCGTH
jgi:hypothetical protein